MPKKLPYIPFYTGDWLKDPALTICTPATRGVWIDLLCAMHDLNQSGELCGTAEQFARIARCSAVEITHAMSDLQTTGAADVEFRGGKYVAKCRRMVRAARLKQIRTCAGSLGGRAKAKQEQTPEYENENEIAFEKFWIEYPKGRKKSKAKAREAFAKALAKVSADVLIEAATAYAASDEGRGKYVKMPATWLNGECWNDDRTAWRDLDSVKAGPSVGSEYRQVELRVFNEHARRGDFLTTPRKDGDRVYGQLKTKAKIESYTTPGWIPNGNRTN